MANTKPLSTTWCNNISYRKTLRHENERVVNNSPCIYISSSENFDSITLNLDMFFHDKGFFDIFATLSKIQIPKNRRHVYHIFRFISKLSDKIIGILTTAKSNSTSANVYIGCDDVINLINSIWEYGFQILELMDTNISNLGSIKIKEHLMDLTSCWKVIAKLTSIHNMLNANEAISHDTLTINDSGMSKAELGFLVIEPLDSNILTYSLSSIITAIQAISRYFTHGCITTSIARYISYIHIRCSLLTVLKYTVKTLDRPDYITECIGVKQLVVPITIESHPVVNESTSSQELLDFADIDRNYDISRKTRHQNGTSNNDTTKMKKKKKKNKKLETKDMVNHDAINTINNYGESVLYTVNESYFNFVGLTLFRIYKDLFLYRKNIALIYQVNYNDSDSDITDSKYYKIVLNSISDYSGTFVNMYLKDNLIKAFIRPGDFELYLTNYEPNGKPYDILSKIRPNDINKLDKKFNSPGPFLALTQIIADFNKTKCISDMDCSIYIDQITIAYALSIFRWNNVLHKKHGFMITDIRKMIKFKMCLLHIKSTYIIIINSISIKHAFVFKNFILAALKWKSYVLANKALFSRELCNLADRIFSEPF